MCEFVFHESLFVLSTVLHFVQGSSNSSIILMTDSVPRCNAFRQVTKMHCGCLVCTTIVCYCESIDVGICHYDLFAGKTSKPGFKGVSNSIYGYLWEWK